MVWQEVTCEKCDFTYKGETTFGKSPTIITKCPMCNSRESVNVAGCQPPKL